VIARVSDIRDELNRLGMMAHTAMNQDASDMRNIMEDLAERLVQLGGGWITTSANGHKGAPVDANPGHNPGTEAYDVLEHLPR
jgi:DNA-binding ferritin-like protein